MIMFLTHVFLLSQSLFATDQWVDHFQEGVGTLIDTMPPMRFLVVVPPVIRFIRSIDFSDWLVSVQVSCAGAQAPVMLLINAVIISGAVLVIGSQLHTMLALALVPTMDLVRDKRSEERRVGKACVSKCRSRWSRYH